MNRAFRRFRIIVLPGALANISAGVVGRVMFDRSPADRAPQIVGQAIQRHVHAGKPRIAAFKRNLVGVQDRRDRRRLQIGHVRVPDGFAAAEAANRFPVRARDVRNHVDFGFVRHGCPAVLHDWGKVQYPEVAAEREQVVVRQFLVGKQERRVFQPSRIDQPEFVVGQVRQVGPGNDRSHRVRQRFDVRIMRLARRAVLGWRGRHKHASFNAKDR